jgi:hypothetical protein
MAALLGVGGTVAVPMAAQAAETPQISLDVTENPGTGISIAIEGTGFGDVKALPGQAEPHVYFMLSEIGADLSEVAQTDTAISAEVAEDGTIDDVLDVPLAELDQAKSYEVISWPSRSYPTDATLYARAAAEIDWAALFPETAQPVVPTFTAESTVVAGESVSFAIEGTGFGDVKALPGQAEPHVYFMLSEIGADLSEVAQTDTAISAEVAEDGTISDVLTVPVAELDETTSYEVISWPSRSFPSDATLYARTAVTIDWAALFPEPEPEQPAVPSFTAESTVVAGESVSFAIEGTGFGDVKALPGQTEPHAYFTLIEKGSDLANVSQSATAISAEVAEDGTISDVLTVPIAELDETKSYEIISWPSRSFPSESNLYARADVTIDWAALLPAPVYTPELAVSPATDLDPAGDTVTVTGTGYNPAQPIYVFFCRDVELPANLWTVALSCTSGSKVIYAATDTTAGRVTFDEDGSFEVALDVRQLNGGATSVYTAANHTAMTDRGQDAKATLAFAAVVEPEQPTGPTFTAESTVVDGERVEFAIEGSGYGDVVALPGQSEPHVYFTLVEKGADLATVTQGTAAVSAAVAADGTVSDTLVIDAYDLDSSKSYEIISWPSRSFPSESNLYARADVTIDWDALSPTPKPTEEPAPEPTEEPTPKPTEEPTPEPTEEPTPKPTEEPAPEPSEEPTPEPSEEPTVEPTAPVEPTTPAEPTEPGTPAEPTEPAEPGTPAEPTEPAEPGTPAEPTEPAEPGTPAEPTEPGTPAEPTEPGTPADPTEPSAPAEPTDPTEPSAPAEPTEPAAPAAPSESESDSVEIVDQNGASVDNIVQGGSVTFSVRGVEAGTEFAVTVHSDPITLPAAVADAQGVASTTWTVPADFPVGEHTVIFDSGSATYKATFTVVASEAEQGNGSALTPTGSDSAAEMLAGVAIMTMLSAGVLLLARRRSLANSGR